MSFNTSSVVGMQLDKVSDSPEWNVNEIQFFNDGRYKYGQADGAIAQYALCRFEEDGTATEGNTTNLPSTQPSKVGIAVSAMTDEQFGWFFIGPGNFSVLVAATCAADVKLTTTATDGAVDDASGTLIEGLTLVTATTAAATGTCLATQELVTASQTTGT